MRLKFLSVFVLVAIFMAFNFMSEDPTTAFLDSLNDKQLSETLLEFDDQSRETWHFLPSQMWPRKGITLNQLTEDQKVLFFNMLKHFLSETGYQKTQRIIDLERVLAEMENNPTFRDAGAYYIAIYGSPKKDKLWAWSFEGHHVSLNFTVSGGELSVAPRFFGANPATITTGDRKGERTLAKEEDLAFQLINALSDDQKNEVVFRDDAFPDITTAKLPEVKPLNPVGIKAEDLNDEQQSMLKALIDEYLSTLPKHLAEARSNKIYQEEFSHIWFGWAGSLIKGKPHYYRVQGKTFLIELDNTQNQANHIHLVWRDFDGDFGRDLIKEHYHTSNHHKHD